MEGVYTLGTFDVDHVRYATVSAGLAYHF